MTRDNLSDALNNIDESFIEEAENINHKKSASKIIKFSVLAACICLLSLGGFRILHGIYINGKPPVIDENITVAQNETTTKNETIVNNNTTTKEPTIKTPDEKGMDNNQLSGGEEIQYSPKINDNIIINGTGFTEKEIESYINSKKSEILSIIQMEYGSADTISVSKKPYSHMSFGENSYLNKDAIMLPILVNGKITATAEIVKAPDGLVDSINIGGNKWSVYNDVLLNTPEEEIVFAYLGDSAFEFMVLSDNSVIFPIKDVNDYSENYLNSIDKLYEITKTEYNTLSGNDLINQNNLIRIK